MVRKISLVLFSILFAAQLYAAKTDHPILVLARQADFGLYTTEMLKTEGINEFRVDSLAGPDVTLSYLKGFDVVILAQKEVNPNQKEMLASFVRNGGKLIAFMPDKKLSEIFGIKDAAGSVSEGYLAVDPRYGENAKITTETMQIHGKADKYTLLKGKMLAALYSDPKTATGCPAIVNNQYGNGQAVAFLYNLPQSVVYTRQGNPQFAGIEKDGINGLRGMDLFTEGWVNPSKNLLNQADEQMRILSHCIEKMVRKPLPKLWYFPDGLKSLATLTNDGEENNDKEFDPQFADIDAKGAKMTIYIMAIQKSSKAFVGKWASRGHEMVGHPDDTREAPNPHWNKMDSVIRTKKAQVLDKYGITQRTNTNHWFVWCGRNAEGQQDFAAEAKLEAKNGIELDCNYAHYDNGSNQGHFLGQMGYNQGNYAGSGMVMKFCDNEGKIINVYQHFNNVYDQQYSENKDTTGFCQCFKGLLDRSLDQEVYSFLSIKSHNWAYPFSKKPLMQMLDYANAKGIPVWTAEKLLDFMKMKDDAKFENLSWSGTDLSFDLSSSLSHSSKLTFLIPASFNGKKMKSIQLDGQKVKFTTRSVKGSDYAFISVEGGKRYKYVVNY